MFKMAGVACVVSLAALLGACTHPSPPNTSEPKSWTVENVAGKSTAELYAKAIAPAVFEPSGSEVIDGYTVESGNLVMPDASVGSLVTVRSRDGSLTAVVEKPGKSGLLVINNKGESRFTPYPDQDYSLPDTVPGKEAIKTAAKSSSATASTYRIDIMIGYSRAAVRAVGGDAHANALAQVESVNLALRNSLVSNVSLRLVGVQIVEQEYSITPQTLNELPRIFAAGISANEPDMVYAVFGGHPDDSAVGWAHMPGRYALGWAYGEAFRHEVGHNAGGGHCANDASVPYGHGHANGKTSTAQCGNENPYYSTPAVRDAHGLLIGDAATADMARVWRENAERLSSYAHTLPPAAPENFAKVGSTGTTITFSWNTSPKAVRYEIYRVKSTGDPIPKKIGDSTTLTFTATDVFGEALYYVKAFNSREMASPSSNSVVTRP